MQTFTMLCFSDLPDSPSEPRENHPLVDLASELIAKLNEKYAGQGMGSFFLFHRHRVTTREKDSGWDGSVSAAN